MSGTTPTTISADVTAQVLRLTARIRTSPQFEHSATDEKDTERPSKSDLRSTISPGAMMRQLIDIKLIDEFATWLSAKEDTAGFVGLLRDVFVIGISARFRNEYSQGLASIDPSLTDCLANLKSKVSSKTLSAGLNDPVLTSTSKHWVINPHTSFFETLIAASNPGDMSPTGLGEDAIALVSTCSLKPRQTFWSDDAKELRDEFLSAKGWTIGGWPDLPEDLRNAANGQRSQVSAAQAEASLPSATDEQILRGWCEEHTPYVFGQAAAYRLI